MHKRDLNTNFQVIDYFGLENINSEIKIGMLSALKNDYGILININNVREILRLLEHRYICIKSYMYVLYIYINI